MALEEVGTYKHNLLQHVTQNVQDHECWCGTVLIQWEFISNRCNDAPLKRIVSHYAREKSSRFRTRVRREPTAVNCRRSAFHSPKSRISQYHILDRIFRAVWGRRSADKPSVTENRRVREFCGMNSWLDDKKIKNINIKWLNDQN